MAGKLHPGILWGHSSRGLIWNPVFALLPWFYLERFTRASSSFAVAFWALAFVLGFPHAGYTALEIRHYLLPHDGVADRRTRSQLAFFSAYLVLGAALGVWYVERGAAAVSISTGSGLDDHLLMALLAWTGSVGAVMGLQDVLVMDLVLRPHRVLRAAVNSHLCRRWLWITLPWALVQFLLAEALRTLAP